MRTAVVTEAKGAAASSVRGSRRDGQRRALALHDAGAGHRNARHQVPVFSNGTDLLRPDRRGHGAGTRNAGRLRHLRQPEQINVRARAFGAS